LSFSQRAGPVSQIYSFTLQIGGTERRQYDIELEVDQQGAKRVMTSLWHHLPGYEATLLKRSESRSNDTIRVQTYNIWNFDGEWPVRKHIIAQVVKAEDPDVIAWQEIREMDGTTNEIIQLNELIPGYSYMYVSSMKFPDSDKHEEEGIGIFVRKGIEVLSQKVLKMKHDGNCPDANTRSAVLLQLVMNGNRFNFVGTHWSYDKTCQIGNALDVWNFTRNAIHPEFMLGDLNIVSDYTLPTDILTGKDTSSKYPKGDYVDIWEVKHPEDKGWTFPSGVKANLPKTRCDRILSRPGVRAHFDFVDVRIVATDIYYYVNGTITTVAQDPPTQEYWSSDHYSVVADFIYKRDKKQ